MAGQGLFGAASWQQLRQPSFHAVAAGQPRRRLPCFAAGGSRHAAAAPGSAWRRPSCLNLISSSHGATASGAAAPPTGAVGGAANTGSSLDLANNCVPLPGLAMPVAMPAAAAAAAASGVAAAGSDGNHTLLETSQDEIDQYVQNVLEHEIENINQAVHAAFEQEMETVKQTVQEAVETALLDRSFDIKANFNTMVALTGVIMYWRGIWNLFDAWLGTENLSANVSSVIIGLGIMLLFRIFKLPLAEFW